MAVRPSRVDGSVRNQNVSRTLRRGRPSGRPAWTDPFAIRTSAAQRSAGREGGRRPDVGRREARRGKRVAQAGRSNRRRVEVTGRRVGDGLKAVPYVLTLRPRGRITDSSYGTAFAPDDRALPARYRA